MMIITRVKYLTTLNIRDATIYRNRNALSLSAVPKERQVKIDNYEINYLKVGKGANKVLCVPGSFGTIWTDFKHQVEGFDRDRFTLIVYDPPGCGKSRPPDKSFIGNFYEEDAHFLHKFAKALNVTKYSLLGWSAGGIVSLIHAARYPNAVEKLVTWGAISFISPRELDNYERGKDPMIDSAHAPYLHARIKNSRLYSYPEGKHNIHMKFAEDFNRRVQDFLLEQ